MYKKIYIQNSNTNFININIIIIMIINFDYKRFITSNYEIILMTSIIIRNKYELNFSQASILPLITIYKITIYVYIYILL